MFGPDADVEVGAFVLVEIVDGATRVLLGEVEVAAELATVGFDCVLEPPPQASSPGITANNDASTMNRMLVRVCCKAHLVIR